MNRKAEFQFLDFASPKPNSGPPTLGSSSSSPAPSIKRRATDRERLPIGCEGIVCGCAIGVLIYLCAIAWAVSA